MANHWQDFLVEHRSSNLGDLFDLLRFKSVSADSAFMSEVVAASDWIARKLTECGVEHVQKFPPATHPIIYGELAYSIDAPTVFIYGHYDVQPPDPLDQWISEPFAPEIRDGRIYARGATDMKGNLLLPLIALKALTSSGEPPRFNLKFLIEGQEEIGSPALQTFVRENRALLACDFVVSADSGQWREDIPAIGLGVRGMSALQVDIKGPSHDLHSGIYGGGIMNPLLALTKLLGTLHDNDGHVLVEGFYDDVKQLTDSERNEIALVPFHEEEFKAETGSPSTFGEKGYSSNERMWARPTLEYNGIWGGYQGEGTKTVIPSEAHAKITCRLVAGQDPDVIYGLVKGHLERHAPQGVITSVVKHPASARAYSASAKMPGIIVAAEILREEYGRDPLYIRSGGSVPIYDMFKSSLGADIVMFGFGLEDENLHSPNEFIRLASFDRGQACYCKFFQRLGDLKKAN